MTTFATPAFQSEFRAAHGVSGEFGDAAWRCATDTSKTQTQSAIATRNLFIRRLVFLFMEVCGFCNNESDAGKPAGSCPTDANPSDPRQPAFGISCIGMPRHRGRRDILLRMPRGGRLFPRRKRRAATTLVPQPPALRAPCPTERPSPDPKGLRCRPLRCLHGLFQDSKAWPNSTLVGSWPTLSKHVATSGLACVLGADKRGRLLLPLNSTPRGAWGQR